MTLTLTLTLNQNSQTAQNQHYDPAYTRPARCHPSKRTRTITQRITPVRTPARTTHLDPLVVRRITHDDETLTFWAVIALFREIVGVGHLGQVACRVYFVGYA